MEVQQRYGDQVRFIGMPGLSGAESMARFVDQTGTDAFPHIPDETGALWERFDVRQQRTYIFINDDGTARMGSYGQLEADVEQLIAS